MDTVTEVTLEGKCALKVNDFRDLLTGALVATGKDSSLPTLTGIYIQFKEGVLRATATDRYRLITGETSATGESFDLLMFRGDAERIIRICKDFKNSSLEVTLERVGKDQAKFTALDQSVTFRLLDGTFPPYEHLLKGEEKAIGRAAFNPALLGDFNKVPTGYKGDTTMKLTFTGEGKLAQVSIHHDSIVWRGLLMPMRYKD